MDLLMKILLFMMTLKQAWEGEMEGDREREGGRRRERREGE